MTVVVLLIIKKAGLSVLLHGWGSKKYLNLIICGGSTWFQDRVVISHILEENGIPKNELSKRESMVVALPDCFGDFLVSRPCA